MHTALTPQAVARTRRWITVLATDPTAPDWFPSVLYSTPEPLRAAARWLVDKGHALGMSEEMVSILLALYAIDAASELDGWTDIAFVPGDAA
jgi:hypothetical protein